MSKTVIIYHKNCIDGLVAGWITWVSLGAGEGIRLYPYQYGDPFDVFGVCADADLVEIVDVSFPPDVMGAISRVARRVVLRDHHESAIRKLHGYHWDNVTMELDVTRSGALLAWDAAKERRGSWMPVPERAANAILWLAERVSDRDLWQFKLGLTRETNRLIGPMHHVSVYAFNDWFFAHGPGSVNWELSIVQGDALLRDDEARISQAMQRAWHKTVSYKDKNGEQHIYVDVPIVNVTVDIVSETLHRLARESLSKMAIGFYIGDKGISVSFRSTDDGPNVAQFAESFGGSGHEHAAGCNTPYVLSMLGPLLPPIR